MSPKRKLAWSVAAIVLILLVAIPMATVRIKIDFPPAQPVQPVQAKPVYISIDAKGAIRVDGATSSLPTLVDDVAARTGTADKDQQRISVQTEVDIQRADDAQRADVTRVLQRLRDAGWRKIGLISEPAKAG